MAQPAPGADRASPLDLAALALLVVFVLAASVGGFLVSVEVGFYSLAGSCLVSALVLGLAPEPGQSAE